MKTKVTYIVVFLTIEAWFSTADNEFISYLQHFKKPYANENIELTRKISAFEENKETWKRHNANRSSNSSAVYGPTEFSDMTPQEFFDTYLSCYSFNRSNVANTYIKPLALVSKGNKTKGIPQKIDWRNKPGFACEHCVTPVGNQKSCGACWAFATVETVESMHAIKTGSLRQLSVQQVIDCSENYKSLKACHGGDTCTALSWMKEKLVRLEDAKDYPLTDKSERCKARKPLHGVSINDFTCQDYVNVEDEMVKLLATFGPLTVSVDATSWQNYQGGIIQYNCETSNNHAVQIVGYDLTGDVPYYIVRNSWGTGFGDKGYLYVKIGGNVCGIAQEVSTVYVL